MNDRRMDSFKSLNYFISLVRVNGTCEQKQSNWSGQMFGSNFLVNIKKHMKGDRRMSNSNRFAEKKR